jgi:hypothetical protein
MDDCLAGGLIGLEVGFRFIWSLLPLIFPSFSFQQKKEFFNMILVHFVIIGIQSYQGVSFLEIHSAI